MSKDEVSVNFQTKPCGSAPPISVKGSQLDKRATIKELTTLLNYYNDLQAIKKVVNKIFLNREEIIKACNSETAQEIVEGLDPNIPVFMQLANMKEDLLKIYSKLRDIEGSIDDSALNVTHMLLDALKYYIRLDEYKDDFTECIESDEFATLRDFLQGDDLLYLLEMVAKSTVDFMEALKTLRDLKYLHSIGVLNLN